MDASYGRPLTIEREDRNPEAPSIWRLGYQGLNGPLSAPPETSPTCTMATREKLPFRTFRLSPLPFRLAIQFGKPVVYVIRNAGGHGGDGYLGVDA